MNEVLVARLKRDNTAACPCVVQDSPDAHTVWLLIENQQFCITAFAVDTLEEAEWMRDMLAQALARLIANITRTPPPPSATDKEDAERQR